MTTTLEVTQLDNSVAQHTNCVAATCTECVLAVSNGVKGGPVSAAHRSPMPAAIRARSGVSPALGLPFATAISAVHGLTGILGDDRYGVPWAQVVDLIHARHPIDHSIEYAVIHGGPWDACPSWPRGHHSIGTYGITRYLASVGFTEVLVGDPLADGRYSWLPEGPDWWPLDLLRRACAGSAGPGVANLIVWPVPPPVAVKRTVRCAGGYAWTAPSGSRVKKAALPVGMVATVVATVTGLAWAFNCTTAKSGTAWYKITHLNGVSVATKYGVPYLYAAVGRF